MVDRWLSSFFFAISAVALGHALQISNGNQHPDAVLWLTVAVVSCLAGVAVPTAQRIERWGEHVVVAVLLGGFAFQLTELLVAPPGMYIRYGPGWHVTFFRGLIIAAVVVGGLLPGASWLKHV